MDTLTHEPGNGMKRSFEVGLLGAEDAEGVAHLFRSVYGEDYPIKIFYDPVQLVRANQEGDYYSILARSAEGEVIGIHNLFRSAPSRSVYEWGVGLVLKEWRGTGVSGAIERFMIETLVPQMEMHTVFGEPVTNHVQMQKHTENFGFQPTALEVGLMPGEAYAGEGVMSSRVSTLMCFRIYRNIPQKIFVPIMYREAIRFMYGTMASGRTFSESSEPVPVNTVSEVRTDVFDFAKVARISVYQVDSEFGEHMRNLESEAVAQGLIVIQAWLKLTSPWVGEAVHILQDRGFFLGGVMPQWFDEDALLMQKLLFTPDFESIHLYSDRARRLLDLVKADWHRSCDR